MGGLKNNELTLTYNVKHSMNFFKRCLKKDSDRNGEGLFLFRKGTVQTRNRMEKEQNGHICLGVKMLSCSPLESTLFFCFLSTLPLVGPAFSG